MTKKEKIYVIKAFLISFTGLTWVQIAYNDPAVMKGKSLEEWATLLLISLAFVLASTFNTWGAYLSNPTEIPPSPPIQQPGGTKPTDTPPTP
jgi:hypothetical protein